MTNECRVSVVIATYNRSSMLRENLDSVLNQDCDCFEAIYVDDGSTDDTPDVLAEYLERYPERLRVLRIPNGGQGLARNEGAKIAGGRLLLFSDDDTISPSNWVSEMLRLYELHGADALCGGFGPFSMKNRTERYLHYRLAILFGGAPKPVRAAPMMGFMLPAEIFRETGGFIKPAIEDWALCHALRRNGRTIYYDPSVKVVHHYQTEWTPAVRRIRMSAILGMNDHLDRGGNGLAYILYSAYRMLTSPLWSLWRFPIDLYPLSLQMEIQFFTARCEAYLAHLRGERLSKIE